MKSKLGSVALAIARCVYGLFFIFDGALRVIGAIQGSPKPTFAQPAAEAFNGPLFAAPFTDPLLGTSFIVAGLALLFNRTAPLGVAILLPSIVVIFFFHLFLTGQIAWGAGHLLFVLFLLWVYRHAFAPLWNHGKSAA
jgi:hypothetical protein